MPSYNEVDGIPSHANRWMLQRRAARGVGLRRTIVSDWLASAELGAGTTWPRTRPTRGARRWRRAWTWSCRTWRVSHPGRAGEGRAGARCRDRRAVARVLREKFELGLFEDPYVDANLEANAPGTGRWPGGRRGEAIVLLKNAATCSPRSRAAEIDCRHRPQRGGHAAGGYTGAPSIRLASSRGCARAWVTR